MTRLWDDLGIANSEEDTFGWIAEVALRAELPPGWDSRTDEANDSVLYVNNDTLTTSLVNPLVPFLKEVIETGRMFLQNPVDGLFEEQRAMLWQAHRDELDFWYGPVPDEEGNEYYVNTRDGISSWHDPRLAKAYEYDLQCLLLNHMQALLAPASENVFDGGTPWENEDGAQILTLDGTPLVKSMKFRASFSKALSLARRGGEDHTQTMKKMTLVVNRIHDTIHAEEKTQRSHLQEKVEARRLRKRSHKSSNAVCKSVEENEQIPRARSKARSSPTRYINQMIEEFSAADGLNKVNETVL
jgi:hypothetical protein